MKGVYMLNFKSVFNFFVSKFDRKANSNSNVVLKQIDELKLFNVGYVKLTNEDLVLDENVSFELPLVA